jgi:hypothetical protein
VKQNKHSCWIVLYPEGTRRSPGKVARVSITPLAKGSTNRQAQEFAKANNKKPFQHLLYPRTKGFISTVKCESYQQSTSISRLTGSPPKFPHTIPLRPDFPLLLPRLRDIQSPILRRTAFLPQSRQGGVQVPHTCQALRPGRLA